MSNEDPEIVRYALRVAQALEEIEYHRANLVYDKERMSESEKRIERLEKALQEVLYD